MEEEESLEDDSGSMCDGDDCDLLSGAGGVNLPGGSFRGNGSGRVDDDGDNASLPDDASMKSGTACEKA